jgi:propionate CoA-transferase
VSRFGSRIIGPGGFINISQNARKMIFSGTFTSGGLKIGWPGGQTRIEQEGRENKFVKAVQQVSYSGGYAAERGQEALYVTERAVFRRNGAGRLELIEIAPGVDLERDVIARMDFRPDIARDLKTMDARLFRPEPMGLLDHLDGQAPRPRSDRLAGLR